MSVMRIEVPDAVVERLAQAAVAQGTSAEAVAAGVLATFGEERRPLSFAGAMHSGRGDLSERVKEILAEEPEQ